jgi:hypothetical protein
MSLILEPDEIRAVKDKWCRTWYEGIGFGLEDTIAKAQAKKDAEAFILFYEAWHRGLGEPLACVQFTIRYKVTYQLNFANVFSEWAKSEGIL